MYIRKTYDMGWIKEVEKYYPGNYGAPGVKRGPRRKKTPEEMEKQNQRNRAKKVQRLIIANFHEGDWHLVLSYKPASRPADHKAAKKDISDFLTAMRKEFKKAGIPLKYIMVTERGKRGAWHHHLILEDVQINGKSTKQLVMKYWTKGGRAFFPLYEDGEYEKLAEYIIKKETKEENEGCSYSRSRNLIIPEPKKEQIHRRRWNKDPKPQKGWYIIRDSLVNGINPVTGYPYQHYTMRRLD